MESPRSVAEWSGDTEPTEAIARALAGGVAAAAEPTLVVDADGVVQFANAAAVEQLRCGSSIVGASAWTLLAPRLVPRARTMLARVVARGAPDEVIEADPDRHAWVECRLVPVGDHVVVRLRNVTARMRRQAKTRLEEVLAAACLEATDFHALLGAVVRRLRREAKFAVGEAWVAAQDGDWRRIAGDGEDATPVAIFERASRDRHCSLRQEVVGAALEHGVPRVHATAGASLFGDRLVMAREAGLVSTFTMPVMEHHRPIAVLAFHHTSDLTGHPWCEAATALAGRLHDAVAHHRHACILDRFLDLSPVGMVIADLDGYFRRVNPWLCTTLGREPQDLLRRPFLELVHPDDRAATEDAIARLAMGTPVTGFINRYRHADGSWRWFEWTTHPVTPEGLLYAAVRDLTHERHLTAATMVQREAIEGVLAERDVATSLDRIAAAVAVGLGSVRAEVIVPRETGEPSEAAPPPDAWAAQVTAPDGRALVRVSGTPDTPRSPSPHEREVLETAARMAGLVVERVRSDEERARLVTAIENLNDIVIITSAEPIDGPHGPRIEFVNRAFERITGYAREEAIGKTPRILQGPMTDRATLDRIRAALAAWQPVRAELANVTKDGRPIWLELDISPIADATGWFTHWVAVERDITERKQLEGQLREAQKMEAVGRLAGGVAHDFNNMLTAIKGFAELLSLDLGEAELGAYVREISRAADRSADLVRKLLAFSRRQVMQLRTVDLSELAREMEPLLRHLVGESVMLSMHTASTPLLVTVDPGQVGQVLLNLVVNARHAMPDGGQLSIATATRVVDGALLAQHPSLEAGVYAMLEVTDTGIGIAPELVEKIFEPFFTTRAEEGGTGLGLSTVFGIVKQSGGHITVESDAGHGTTMTVYLPLTPHAPRTTPRTVGPLPAVRTGAATILVVEDEPMVRASIERILGREGYTILAVGDGPDAERVARDHPGAIDLLLTDVVLPHLNGRRVAELVASHRPGIPIVYMSGYAEDAIVHQGVLEDGIAFLEKPFTRDELLERVGTYLPSV